MSTTDLAAYIQERMTELDLTTSAAAECSGVSRQTWQKLKQAEIQEAKISTLVQVADTLQTTPTHLLGIIFSTQKTGFR